MLHPDEVRRGRNDEETAEKLLKISTEFIELSRKTFTTYTRALQRWYDIYRTFLKVARGHRGYNNLPVGFLHAAVQSHTAMMMDVLATSPFLQFVPTGPEHAASARKAGKLVEEQLLADKFRTKATRLIQTANLFGPAPFKYGWKTTYGNTWKRTKSQDGQILTGVAPSVNPRTGFTGVTFDGPTWEPIDPSDFFPFPGYIDIEDMPMVGERYYMDFEDIVALSEEGLDGSSPVFNPTVVHRMSYNGNRSQAAGDMETELRRNAAAGGVDDRTYHVLTSANKPVMMYDVVGRFPRDFSMVDPETGEVTSNLIVTIADGMHVVQVAPIPQWDRKKPYGALRLLEDMRYYHSPGMIEIGERLQWAINKYASRQLDSLDQALDPLTLFDENSGINPNRMYRGTGSWVGVNGLVGNDQIRQMVPDVRGLQLGFQEIATLQTWLQNILGLADDIAFGGKGPSRETAHANENRVRAMSVRMGLQVIMAETQWIEPIGQACIDQSRQWLDFDTERHMIGANAAWDAAMGQWTAPVQEDRANFDDVNIPGGVRAISGMRHMSKFAQKEGVAQFMGLMGPMLPALNLRAIVRETVPLFFANLSVDEAVLTEKEMMASLSISAQMEEQGQAGGTPSGPAAGPTGGLDLGNLITSAGGQ